MTPSLRTLLASFLIAAVAPIGLAALDLEQPAFANNGNGGGNGGGHGGGNGGGHGHGHDNGHAKKADAAAETDTEIVADEEVSDGLAPNEMGKLNGVMNADLQAIGNASINSPLGMAREFGEALSDFLDASEDEGETEEEADEDPVTVDELGELMAGMTNKFVTPEQVQAVADKVAGLEDEGEGEDESEPDDDGLQDLDPELAQEIADEANEIHGFTDETEASDDTDDADDTDEIVN